MIKRIAHIGIAVKSLKESERLFEKLLGKPSDRTERVEEQSADLSFYQVGESSLELIEPAGPKESSLARFIEKRGEGIHHICLEVDDLQAEMERLKAQGFRFVSGAPTPGGDGTIVAFIHPTSANGILVELCERLHPHRQ
ncbi:MAG TPA: methylmalonyl-CoA epimerase [Bacteroidota bacterium]|nr:methylmalonyl-CoA epimerase [Bacteroidota bacterium]